MQVKTLLKEITEKLYLSEDPALEANLIAAEVLACKTLDLYFKQYDEVTGLQYEKILSIVNQRVIKKTPLQYLFKTAPFRRLDLLVAPGVLIPRPETEQLVDHALDFLKNYTSPHILELCSGSCAIALSLATELRLAEIDAVEIDDAAFLLGVQNTQKILHTNKLNLYQGDLFSPLPPNSKYDLIISNPPYISIDDYRLLPDEVRIHEPKIALTDDGDGLAIITQIIADAPLYLNKNGAIMLEISEKQGTACRTLLEKDFTDICVLKDYADKIRFVLATLK